MSTGGPAHPSRGARPSVPLGGALARGRPLVLDGGLSNQLEAQGCDLGDESWSARLLADDPGQVEAAHAAYVRAGAEVVITGSYQASAHFGRSVALARAAAATRPACGGNGEESPVRVAASVGPYGALLADGSEYRGRYGLSVRALADFHRPRIEALAQAGPDVLALETVPDVDEAEAMLSAARDCGVPVWLSYTVEGDRTRAGQPLADAFAVANGLDQVIAVGVNCCAAADVGHAVDVASATTGKPVVVYPNSGESWDPRTRTWHGPATFAADSAASWARDWTARGARLIGGCCRVGPACIAALAADPTLRAERRPGR